MREIMDMVMGDVSVVGFDVPAVVLFFVATLIISAVTRSTWWAIFGTFQLFFFMLFVPVLANI